MGLLDDTTQAQYYASDNYGNYQFTSLEHIINQFIVAYVGEEKIISKIKRTDVQFHAMRALQELSFDTFKSCKSQEITVPASLTMILPQDYVNYTKISWVDSSGIKHRLYPTLCNTSNPTNPEQNSDGGFFITADGSITSGTDQLVLDGQYDNVLVGMVIDSGGGSLGGINGNIVTATATTGGVTTITMDNAATVSYVFAMPIRFKNADGSLIQEPASQILVTGLTVSTAVNFLITTAPFPNVLPEIGMFLSSEYFPAGTKVIGLDTVPSGTTYIFLDDIAATANVLNEEITFTSPNSQSDTWTNYSSTTPSENQDDYQDDTFWSMNGERYGLDPQHAQANGSFFIDCNTGKIHFSSNISGKTVILDYISDSLGTDEEMQVHKFAEEAMYKWIAYAILATRVGIPEYIINRYKKERFAETRKAKIRLSNIKLEEITQILRGKSKQIKH